MRNEIIGIISEGVEDQGVIKSILKAFDFDGSEIRFIRPDLNLDASDLHNKQATIGTLQGVKNSCIGENGVRPDFEKFFATQDCNNIVIQMDTMEIEEQDFPFQRPTKEDNPNYSTELRNSVIDKINQWLEGNYNEQLLFAISIEEIEAWCLTIFENRDTTGIVNSKAKLQTYLSRNNLTYRQLKLNSKRDKRIYFEKFLQKKKFHKLAKLKQFAEYNQSLKDFVESVEEKFTKHLHID